MYPHLQSVPLDLMGPEGDDPRLEYVLECFLRARSVSVGQKTTHRRPLLSIHALLLLEIAGPRRTWDERVLRNAWRDISAADPHVTERGEWAQRRQLRARWPGYAASPWLSRPLVALRQRVARETERMPDAYGATARRFLEYALLALLTAKR